jgi:hypothetical protein
MRMIMERIHVITFFTSLSSGVARRELFDALDIPDLLPLRTLPSISKSAMLHVIHLTILSSI